MTADHSIEDRVARLRSSLADKRERAAVRSDNIRSKVAASSDVLPSTKDLQLRDLINLVRQENLKPSFRSLAEIDEPAAANHGLPHHLKGNAPQLS